MNIFGIIILLFTVIYGFQLLQYAVRFRKIPKKNQLKPTLHNTVMVSVIVPFRNEMDRMGKLVESVRKRPNKEKIEVIWVNDHSNDGSKIFEKGQEKGERWLDLPEQKEGKKSAITWGVKHAHGDWIQVMDADCEPDEKWWEGLLEKKASEMQFSGIRFLGTGIWGNYLSLENTALLVFGAVDLSWGRPSMGNAANMGFSKLHFEQVKGYEGNMEVVGGDDIFLMEKFQRAGMSITYDGKEGSFVSTHTETTLKGLWQQRLRWLKKLGALSNKGAIIKQLMLAVWMISFWVLGLLVSWKWAALIGGLKLIFDALFFYFLPKTFQLRRRLWLLPLVEVLQCILLPILFFTFPLFSFDWKGRKYPQK